MGYSTKSKRERLPKMVLIGDIVGDDEQAVAHAASEVVRLANARSGEGFVAVSPESRKTFWSDRNRTAAIARHTNAFKINEDVVIPLARMGEYTNAIERINIELSISNKLKLTRALRQALNDTVVAYDQPDGQPTDLRQRIEEAAGLLKLVEARWPSCWPI